MNKVALVTGGARGIGRAICLELAQSGYNVVINYLTPSQEAKELQKQIEDEYHVRCLTYKCDVSSTKEVDEMIKRDLEIEKKKEELEKQKQVYIFLFSIFIIGIEKERNC